MRPHLLDPRFIPEPRPFDFHTILVLRVLRILPAPQLGVPVLGEFVEPSAFIFAEYLSPPAFPSSPKDRKPVLPAVTNRMWLIGSPPNKALCCTLSDS